MFGYEMLHKTAQRTPLIDIMVQAMEEICWQYLKEVL